MGDFEMIVGSDVVNDEFAAELMYRGMMWGAVIERDGRYFLRILGGKNGTSRWITTMLSPS